MRPAEGNGVALAWGTQIALRDGVHLNATVYMPQVQLAPAPAPAPAIVAMVPYGADVYHGEGTYFAARGLPFVVVDSRGRGNSQGTFQPGVQEAKDGYDVVEWLAQQPFCDGQVALFGGSYSGYAQWATAKEFPPHLVTITPIAATFFGVHAPMRNNVFYPERLRWLMLTSGRTQRGRLYADETFWTGVCRRWSESGRPFRDLGLIADNPAPIFQEWLAHPEPDAYWDAYNPTADQYARLTLPILTMTGCYDVDQPGALEHYQRHVAHASERAKSRHYLIVGPWDHSGAQLPRAHIGGLKFAPASVIDLRRLHAEWYAWTMQDGPKPWLLENNVAYYVMGAEAWRYSNSLAEVTARHEPYLLDSPGNANDVFRAGTLGDTPGSGPPDSYTFDPGDTGSVPIEAEAHLDDRWILDQRLIMALRGRHLAYLSAPFKQDREITGFFRLSVWLAIDCPDTDFYVSIHEMGADGSALLLSTDVMRARYREGLRTPKLIRSSKPLRYDFEHFTFISRQIKRGHRLRLVIAPLGRIDLPFVQRNYNAGGVVSEETRADARAVTVTLFHDAAHPSALYVPLGQSPSVDDKSALALSAEATESAGSAVDAASR